MHANAQTIAGSIRLRNRETANLSPLRSPPCVCASAIQLQPIANAQKSQRAEADGGRQHDALEQRLP